MNIIIQTLISITILVAIIISHKQCKNKELTKQERKKFITIPVVVILSIILAHMPFIYTQGSNAQKLISIIPTILLITIIYITKRTNKAIVFYRLLLATGIGTYATASMTGVYLPILVITTAVITLTMFVLADMKSTTTTSKND